jgi:hypothetical protein
MERLLFLRTFYLATTFVVHVCDGTSESGDGGKPNSCGKRTNKSIIAVETSSVVDQKFLSMMPSYTGTIQLWSAEKADRDRFDQ